ncbi:hypothetical protein EVAR_40322_1 [Eumeta japonica]|uniref:Uncharacterized protein n=1 Tax=Eumeta variegata TaxID=151549 RepID=A0A4C1Y959_EUMVA|nr:hypothetical protein EVAR_40322_1 [Eumeta japonica]
MYEDRGENLSYLHKYDPACSTTPIDSWGHPVKDPEEMSGSERLRKQIQAEKETKTAKRKSSRKQRSETGKTGKLLSAKQFTSKSSVRQQRTTSTSKKITNDSPNSSPKPTKANLREVNPLVVMPVENPKVHMSNAFLEFAALTIAIQDVTQTMCKNILHIYMKGDIEQLKRKLEEHEGTIYNNKSSQCILGDARQNMAAYDNTCGLVYLDEQATKITGKAKYKTPENDPIVVMTRDTKKHLPTGKHRKLHGSTGTGCGKQRGSFKNLTKRDCIVTATIEAAEDLKGKLAKEWSRSNNQSAHDGFYISERIQRPDTQPSPN